jgi:hypothetical protein
MLIQAFVVGSIDRQNKAGEDRISSFSNVGQNISTLAPGGNIQLMGKNGQKVIISGIMGFFNCIF